MFKRSEKKIKAVFKLQFQATQFEKARSENESKVPQLKAKSLMISLVPVDVGKPTVRLPKVPILEGICTWENPIYETVKLIKEIKTGRIREKFYYIVVSTGSSKSGFLGEVSIDFADLADATKPSKLKLPLQTTKSGAILNVTVQRMQADSDSRNGDDNEASVGESHDSEDISELASPCNDRNGSIEDVESDSNDLRDGSVSGTSAIRMKMLERKVELSELEAESLRKQIIKETKKGEQLIEQIAYLKEEKDTLKVECERLMLSAIGQNEDSNLRSSLEDVKQVLQREKQLNKKLKLQVQKTEDTNSEYVLAVRDLNKKLEQKNAEISKLSTKIKAFYNDGKSPEELTNKCANTDEENMLKQKIEDLHSELEVLKKEKAEVTTELQRLNLDYESLEIESKETYSKLEQCQKEKTEIQQRYAESLVTLKQFKLRVASLEEETKRMARQYSESLNMNDELELEVESLKNELKNQAQVFEEDLEYEIKGKDEMEQRAIKAEGALRKMKRNNAETAERAEEEFKQLSADLYYKIDENEKLALEAATEANEVRQKNSELEVLLNKANNELQINKENYEKILQKYTEQRNGSLGAKKYTQKENEDLERQLASVRKEVEKLMQENASIKSQMEQKKSKEENLHLEVRKLRLKNNETKNQLHDLEMEKGNLKKEITKLQGDLRKKKQGSEQSVARNTAQQKNGNADDGCDASSLLSEVASLKERNKNIESELNEMHEKYSEVSLRFAEVEGERQQLALAVRNLKGGRKI